jgi:hypothetical protein
MGKFMNLFFGPLNKDACLYFYFLSVIFGLSFAFVAITVSFYIIKNSSKIDMKIGFNLVLLLINVFLVYFVNRLLYSMCSKSLN